MKAKELRDLTIDELKQRDKELKEEQFNLKFQAATSQLSNTAKITKTRKDVARVNTLIKEKELKGNNGIVKGSV